MEKQGFLLGTGPESSSRRAEISCYMLISLFLYKMGHRKASKDQKRAFREEQTTLTV